MRLRLLVLPVVLVLALAACGDDDAQDASATSSTTTTTTSTTTTTAPTTSTTTSTTSTSTTTAPVDPKALFVQLVNQHCDTNEVPDPNQATTSPLQGVEHLVTDAEGSELHIDTNRRVVYSTDGEDGILPSKYSFGCDPSVFLGTLPE